MILMKVCMYICIGNSSRDNLDSTLGSSWTGLAVDGHYSPSCHVQYRHQVKVAVDSLKTAGQRPVCCSPYHVIIMHSLTISDGKEKKHDHEIRASTLPLGKNDQAHAIHAPSTWVRLQC